MEGSARVVYRLIWLVLIVAIVLADLFVLDVPWLQVLLENWFITDGATR